MELPETEKTSIFSKEDTNELSSFFDLLACFDYEDKQKEKLVAGAGSLASAPRGPLPATDTKQTTNLL